MKKTIIYIAMIAIAGAIFVGCKGKQVPQKEEWQAVMEEQRRDGWERVNISRSHEALVRAHIEKASQPNTQEIAVLINCNIVSVCASNARTEAARVYAQRASSFVRERSLGDENLNQANLREEFAKFYTAYEVLVQAEVSNVLELSYDVIRRSTNEYRAFFTVNEERASAARLRAMEQALRETQAAQRYAREISRFVQEGFQIHNQ